MGGKRSRNSGKVGGVGRSEKGGKRESEGKGCNTVDFSLLCFLSLYKEFSLNSSHQPVSSHERERERERLTAD